MNREEVIKRIIEAEAKTGRLNAAREIGLCNFVEMRILSCLCESENGRKSVGDIAKSMRMTLPNVSRTIKMLEKDGRVTRTVDEADRRNVLVTITDAGREQVRANKEKMLEFINSALIRLSDEDLSSYLAVTLKIYDAYREELELRRSKRLKEEV